MMAIGDEICADFASPDHSTDDVERLFTHLASLDDSQYSYLNTLVALDENENVVGVCVGYDGARLHQLRRHFFLAFPIMAFRSMLPIPLPLCMGDTASVSR